MGEAREVRVRLALLGPQGSGKTAALEFLHRSFPAADRGPLLQFADRSGRTLLYDLAEFCIGHVGDLPLWVDVYALPGAPYAELVRRMILTGCDGVVLFVDGRDAALPAARAAFLELCEWLDERGRTPETAALVVALSRKDLGGVEGGAIEDMLRPHVEDRLVTVSTRTGEGLLEAFRKATALVLAREREQLEARRQGSPPPRVVPPPALEQEIELAHELYLRASGQLAQGQITPHSEVFLGQVLLELGALTQEVLEEALRARAQALKLQLPMTLEEVLERRGHVAPELVARARRVRAACEVIHEELQLGRLVTELELVPFSRVKQALTLQAKRHFHNALDHLLTRAGHLDRVGRRKALTRLLQVHQGELLREDQAIEAWLGEAAAGAGPAAHDTKSFRALPLFGEVAVSLGLVTREQLRGALDEQRKLRGQGKRRFIGAILQQRGLLSEDDVRRICRGLEDKIADDRIDGYKIVCQLGRGNMALVFAAKQVNLDRMVALKILDPKLLVDQEFIERFLREAQAAARLNHPNIVQAYDVGTCHDLHYFAMEYVDGVTARELADRQPGNRLEQDVAIDVVVQVARALDHAARHHLVHRDVKPGNVMINREGVVKLCDLGLATTLDADGPGEQASATILGSPFYISPEQIEGRPDLDTRADIYSLGAMLFHLLTGRPAFDGRTPEDVCLKHLSEPVPDPAAVSPTVTRSLTPVVFRMMAKDRDARYSSCAEVVKDLLRVRPEAGSEERQALLARRVQEGFPTRRLSPR